MKPIFITSWEEWEGLSESYNFNPAEVVEFSIDKGGGDSVDYKYIGNIPTDYEEEECLEK